MNNIKYTSLDVLIVAGEKLGEVKSPENYLLFDAYGPTEALIVSSVNNDDKIDSSDVGKLNYNTHIYILDENLNQVPVGAVGELCVAGYQIADGYLNHEEETKLAFVENPFDDNEEYNILYRTGDIVRFLPNGDIGIVGRRDKQVKIRGNRVELSEVESSIRDMDIVDDVTVQIVNKQGNNELVAYVVLSCELESNDLDDFVRDYLGERKPDYMVPSYVIQIDEIPLNVNGKVNNKLLPDFTLDEEEYVEPEGYVEEKILEFSREILGNNDFGVTTNLYKVGFSSLNMIQLTSKIYKEFNKEINLGVIFNKLTVRGITDELNRITSVNTVKFESYDHYPLTANQMRMFKESMLTPGKRVFHISMLIETNFNDETKLKNSLIELVNLHPSLRLILTYQNGSVVQKVSDNLDLEKLIAVEYVDKLNDEIIDKNTRAFNLIGEPLFNFSICKTKEKLYLFWVMHHIIIDNISQNILLNNLYQIYLNQQENVIREDLNFLEYVLLESDVESENNKYIQQYYSNLYDEFSVVSLPSDRNDDFKYDYYEVVELNVDKQQIHEYCKVFNNNPYDVFLLSTMLTLNKYLNNNKLMFFTVYNGRNFSRLKNTVGCISKSLLFSLDTSNMNKSLKQCFDEIHDISADLIKHEPNSFIYDYSKIENEFEFNFVSGGDEDVENNDIIIHDCPKSSIRDNTIFYVVEHKNAFNMHILYKSNIYSSEYISKFLNDVVGLIEKIINLDNETTIGILIEDDEN